MLSEIYKTTAKNIEETASLLKLRDALLPKLMLENSDSSSDKLSFIFIVKESRLQIFAST